MACLCEAGVSVLTPCGGWGTAPLSNSCLGSKGCQRPAPCLLHSGQASCQAAAQERGTLFIREIRQLMRDGPQSSCSSAGAGTDAGEVEGREGWGTAHFEIKDDGPAGK